MNSIDKYELMSLLSKSPDELAEYLLKKGILKDEDVEEFKIRWAQSLTIDQGYLDYKIEQYSTDKSFSVKKKKKNQTNKAKNAHTDHYISWKNLKG